MIARLRRSADFERVLRTRSRASSVHFALHHLPVRPTGPTRSTRPGPSRPELSTGADVTGAVSVDDEPAPGLGMVWIGTVVPKRHARRSVTRSLLKRQIRAVVADNGPALGGGLWVVRLRAPFDGGRFVSAASDGLRCEARAELARLVGRVAVALPPAS